MTSVQSAGLVAMVDAIRDQVRRNRSAQDTATSVAGAITPSLAIPDLLSPEQRAGDPERYVQHVLHVEPDASFSVVALVWLPGQQTTIHDHVSWCVTGVYEGAESEQRYELRGDTHLVPTRHVINRAGEADGFAPPGDIHLVRNAGDGKAISLHVYGADIGVLGTSVRRTYDLPVLN